MVVGWVYTRPCAMLVGGLHHFDVLMHFQMHFDISEILTYIAKDFCTQWLSSKPGHAGKCWKNCTCRSHNSADLGPFDLKQADLERWRVGEAIPPLFGRQGGQFCGDMGPTRSKIGVFGAFSVARSMASAASLRGPPGVLFGVSGAITGVGPIPTVTGKSSAQEVWWTI